MDAHPIQSIRSTNNNNNNNKRPVGVSDPVINEMKWGPYNLAENKWGLPAGEVTVYFLGFITSVITSRGPPCTTTIHLAFPNTIRQGWIAFELRSR